MTTAAALALVLVAALGCTVPTPEPSPTPACFDDVEVKYVRQVSSVLDRAGDRSGALAELWAMAEQDIGLMRDDSWRRQTQEALLEMQSDAWFLRDLEAPATLPDYERYVRIMVVHNYSAAQYALDAIDTLDFRLMNQSAEDLTIANEAVRSMGQWVVSYCEEKLSGQTIGGRMT